ncbi:hypothetical protein RFI_14203 [Reticulomyxa filosa]|uniref:Uncharacterized protein n=1 Tax=Reticulomyxa filosa TaxID=46433 RepID=X6NAQ5_RETFI|nr:hypothetical protein RFI_14203 [Reticulomyxa filosa]|eukprot:ETO22983.1 hypothetical protein RFI_14203 [Reticulomyxa filosa]
MKLLLYEGTRDICVDKCNVTELLIGLSKDKNSHICSLSNLCLDIISQETNNVAIKEERFAATNNDWFQFVSSAVQPENSCTFEQSRSLSPFNNVHNIRKSEDTSDDESNLQQLLVLTRSLDDKISSVNGDSADEKYIA